MKIKRLPSLILIFVAASLLLTACSSMSASSWPGVSGGQDLVYMAYNADVLAVRNGSIVWRYPEKRGKNLFYAAPAVAGDLVVVGDYTKSLYGLNAQTGQEKWVFADAKGRYVSAPLIVGETIIAPNADHSVYALNTQGQLQWKFTSEQPNWAKPVSDGKVVYVSSMDHHLYALDLANGSLIWKTDVGGAVIYSPALSEKGVVYVGTLANEIVAVDAAKGQVLWRSTSEGGLWARPTLKDDRLYFGDLKNKVYAISAENGQSIWQVTAGGPVIGAAAADDKIVVFVTETGDVTAVDFDGKVVWNQKVNGKLYTTPLIQDGTVYIGVTAGDANTILAAFDLSGKQIWTLAAPK